MNLLFGSTKASDSPRAHIRFEGAGCLILEVWNLIQMLPDRLQGVASEEEDDPRFDDRSESRTPFQS